MQADPQPLVQVGRLAQTLGDGVERELDGLEDGRVRLEDGGGAPCGRPGDRSCGRCRRHAARVLLGPDDAVTSRLDAQPFRQGVDDADADAVQAARHLVPAAAELAAGVQHGVDDLEGVRARRVATDRYATSVVDDPHRAVLLDAHLDVRGVAGHGLVDRVVDDLPHQVVQAADVGRADVHARPASDRIEAFEDLDAVGVVLAAGGLARVRAGAVGAAAARASAGRCGSSSVKRFLRSDGRRAARTPRRCSTR